MAVVQTLIGNVKGPTGATGATGAQGAQGDAATIAVGSVTTAAYGTAASVTNSGTSGAAVFDFVIPQGAPGETVTDMQNLTLGSITSSSASFPTPTVGETGKVIFGKINKWFSDMAALVATLANGLVMVKTYSCQYTVDANSYASITGTGFGVSTPSGYTPIAFKRAHPGNNTIAISILNAGATGDAGLLVVRNTQSSAITLTAYVDIVYIRTSVLG